MEFAVVSFVEEDSSFSEVPRSWLTDNGTMCWWPNKKSATVYINKGSLPDVHSWNKYPIKIEGYYPTLEKARRIAEFDCSSTDEDLLNKKRKSKKPRNLYSSSSDDESINNVTPPPIVVEVCNNVDNTGVVIDNTIDHITDDNSSTAGNAVNDTTLVTDQFVFQDEETMNMLKQVYEKVTSIEFYVKCIDERLRKLELQGSGHNVSQEDFKSLMKDLPLKEIESIGEFEDSLQKKEYLQAFSTFIARIGGKNAKDNIHRLLKSCFTNQLAIKCSWLGLRGNHRIANLSFIQMMKNVIRESYPNTTDKEFEVIGSEWFRLAKLRLKSEKQVSQN